ncbi:hypothetical protein LJC55_04130, partial [Eubacteriales bacterium OttesenSCG-928-N14]|nr:hypothetical protein [Eubacteriales bacterium OttesenSCG-928-N14]
CHFMVGKEPRTVSYESMIVTCVRAANGIPYVCEATPGLKSALSLPNTIPTAIFRSDNDVPDPRFYPENVT